MHATEILSLARPPAPLICRGLRSWARFGAGLVLASALGPGTGPTVVLGAETAAASVTDGYVRAATWQESMFQSRQRLEQLQRERNDAARSFTTEVLRGDDPAQHLEVPIDGWTDLYLTVDDEGDYHHDVANWAEARLVNAAGTVTYLDTVEPVSARQAWGQFQRDNRSTVGGPLRIAAQTFSRGLGTHAQSLLHFRLTEPYNRFEAWVGVDASRGKEGRVRFQVSATPGSGSEASATDELWELLARDFGQPSALRQMRWERVDRIWSRDWRDLRELALRYAGLTRGSLKPQAEALARRAEDVGGLQAVREIYYRARATDEAATVLKQFDFEALRLALEDLSQTYGAEYPQGPAWLEQLEELEQALSPAGTAADGSDAWLALVDQLETLHREALLANPLLDFDKLLLVRRSVRNLGLPTNWQGNSSLPRSGFDNEIAVLSPVAPGGKLESLYRPEGGKFVGDLELHFAADRLLFSSIGSHQRWQVFEIGTDGQGLRQVTPGDQPDVDSYDGCYLPDGRILFCSTACFVGVPCVDGGDHVANLYLLGADGAGIRQVSFDQDHDWCPTVLPNGRVLYLRWEYADTPHSQTRLLFHMNPDGTGQTEFYGSNSYWPNGIFYARPIPRHPTRVVGIVTGHHGVRRMGELVIFDPAQGRHEATGVVQRIPGRGQKVEPLIRDNLVDASWPKFLHPYPLSEKYFLVASQPTQESLWGIYLVDVFDNRLLLAELDDYALLEPMPLRKTPTPPAIPDRIDPQRKDALVYLADVYQGGGLKGVPRGTVKALRVFAYHWAYQGMGGLLGTIGLDGPWDIRRILGTVPVAPDGSAYFRVPANTPISVQPLDSEGQAVQLMRSWFTGMPGENLSCVGCHETQNATPPVTTRPVAFSQRTPDEIKPWHGPARGFSYAREVQPVMDQYCVGCHDGQPRPDGRRLLDLRGTERIADFRMVTPGQGGRLGGRFSVGYANLHRYVRRPGIESDYHLLTPLEFHASTTELVQMLRKGHYRVDLDAEAWDRLITWIDLNAPFHGTWHEELQDSRNQRDRRNALQKLYAGLELDPESVPVAQVQSRPFEPPPPLPEPGSAGASPYRRMIELDAGVTPDPAHELAATEPGSAASPYRRTIELDAGVTPDPAHELAATEPGSAGASPYQRTIELGAGVTLELVLIPAGEFVMGDLSVAAEEHPPTLVRIARPFWMGRLEVSNEQYARFDPAHDSRVESKQAYQFGIHGYPLNTPRQPVVRVSWERALAFAQWLSSRTGEHFSLPTEAQWEYACRAGTSSAFSFGNIESDFSKFANLADAKLAEFASDPYTVAEPLKNTSPYDDYVPKDTRFNDGGLVSTDVGSYQANPWGLHDLHGNVWEWTRTSHRPYPYREDDGRNDLALADPKVVRGGSWRDRPVRAQSTFRLAYAPWQSVFNVGFRVVCEVELGSAVAALR